MLIKVRYLFISSLFVDDFICYYFNYVLIIILVCCIADSNMNISFPDFEDFGYIGDPCISGDKSISGGLYYRCHSFVFDPM